MSTSALVRNWFSIISYLVEKFKIVLLGLFDAFYFKSLLWKKSVEKETYFDTIFFRILSLKPLPKFVNLTDRWHRPNIK